MNINFKIGDWVESDYGVNCIISISKGIYLLDNMSWCLEEEMTPVCQFAKNEPVKISEDGESYERMSEEKFYSYDPLLSSPYLVINVNGDIHNYQYCKAYKQPEYVPYIEPELNWIGKEVIVKDVNYITKISGISQNLIGNWFITFNNLLPMDLQRCLNDITWFDNTPFGLKLD